jgi:hypothetical protein
MHLIGRRATPESIAAGIICHRGPDLADPPRYWRTVALIDALMDWHWSLLERVLKRLFWIDLETREAHVHDGLVAAIVGGMVALALVAVQTLGFLIYDLGRRHGAVEHAQAQVELRRR